MRNFIQKLAKDAGAIILSAETARMSTEEKTDARNVVTNYDKEVQDFIFSSFEAHIAGIALLGEEAGLGTVPDAGPFCIVDPIDGTSNFVKGVKRSCVSIAYGQDGMVLIGCVYDPYLDEMFYAEKGIGAFLNNKRIARNNDVELSSSLVCFGTCPYDLNMSKEVFEIAELVFRNSNDLRRTGCAALEICYTAANRYDLFFEMILYPWDYAAASLFVQEAGGRICTFDSTPVSLQERCSVVSGSERAVSDFIELLADRQKR